MRTARVHVALALLAMLGGLFLAAVSLATNATPASAHASLVRTSPVQGSVIQSAPTEIIVTFSEHVSAVDSKIKVVAPNSQDIDSGTITVDGASLRIPVKSDVPRGTYLVNYRVISADSHPVGAAFTYSVGAPSATGVNTGGDSGRTDPAVAIAVSVAQYLGYAGLILIAGPALVLYALWPARLDRRGPTRLAYLGIGVAWLGALLDLHLQVPYANGGGLFTTSPHDLAAVVDSRFGVAHLVRLGILALAAFLLGPHLAGVGGQVRRVILMILAVAGLATFGISGHPSASGAPALTVIADVAHLAGASLWLGGLIVLFGYLLRQANDKELGVILPIWSNWATMAVAVLVLAGTAQALVEIASVKALFGTTYGRLVVLKVVLLGGVLTVAWFSRRLANRKPDERAAGRLRRTVLVEVLGAVVILALASALVQTAPARSVVTTAAGDQGGPQSVTLNTSLYQLQLDITPAASGDNELHLYAYTPAGAPLKVLEWKGTAGQPAAGIDPIAITFLPLTDSHATGQIDLPATGTWQFNLTLRTSDVDEATVTTTFKIS